MLAAHITSDASAREPDKHARRWLGLSQDALCRRWVYCTADVQQNMLATSYASKKRMHGRGFLFCLELRTPNVTSWQVLVSRSSGLPSGKWQAKTVSHATLHLPCVCEQTNVDIWSARYRASTAFGNLTAHQRRRNGIYGRAGSV